jgi:hypothetical protein
MTTTHRIRSSGIANSAGGHSFYLVTHLAG